jgi:hypothetical protein
MNTLRKNFAQPDETRTIPKTKVELVSLGETTAMRMTAEPGWKWSECVKPTAGTESCEVAHTIFVQQGRMAVRMKDGTQLELGPSDVSTIAPGHDAWVLGDEPFVGIDFVGGVGYGKAKE